MTRMDNPILARIREAEARGTGATVKAEPCDPEQARLAAHDLPAGALIALFKERAESSGAEVFMAGEAAVMKQILAEIIPANAVVAVAGRDEPDLVPGSCRQVQPGPSRESDLFEVDVAITDAALGVAESGSLLLEARDHLARLISLTAMMHVAILESDRILPDLLDLQEALDSSPQSGYTLITGPSKTADIEMELVKGVHGPARLCVILLAP
jgi:L-lactate dehydrogenase complex protein LldG